MSTAQRIFGIAELLEIIICQVDAHQIPELKLVNKSWRDAISSSKAIGRARVLHYYQGNELDLDDAKVRRMSPEEVAVQVELALCDTAYTYAIYGYDDWVRINPSLREVHVVRFRKEDGGGMELNIRLPLLAEVAPETLDEFVTDPPCQLLTLMRLIWDDTDGTVGAWKSSFEPMTCSVGRIEGLRIRDILAASDEIEKAQQSNTDDGEEIVAGLLICATQTDHDEKLRGSYINGPLPRYRNATDGVVVDSRDQELHWHPSMDAATSR